MIDQKGITLNSTLGIDIPDANILGFQIKQDASIKEEDIRRLKAADSLISVVLGILQYIDKLKGHQEIAPVEDIQRKINKAYQKLLQYLNRDELEQGETLEADNAQNSDALPFDKHPFLVDFGGMPLELDNLDKEWAKALGLENVLDRTEIQRKIKEKLENRLKNALKLVNNLRNRLTARARPANTPVQKLANTYVKKYEMVMQKLKNEPILKPGYKPSTPTPAPESTPRYLPTPRPR